jgi:glycosyltransferase involved in cell wall biosynthesis
VVREADVVITLDCHFAAAMHRIRPKRLVHLSLSCTPRQEYLAGAGIQRGLDLLQYAWLERSLLGMADGVIAASNLHARDLRRFTLLPAVTPHILAPVFPSGHADAAVAREDSRGTVTLLSAGRLVPAKNFAAVIDLAARLRELPCRFIIAGDGPERARLQARAERAGVDRRIVFAGNVPDLDMLLSQADIFLHPSRNESFGMVVFEAMHAGVAPVCAAGRVVTACAEFASHGADAVFVDFDNTEAAALTIAALIESPERRSSLGRAAKITAARMLRRPYTAAFRAVLAGLS